MKIVALLSGGKDSCYNLVHCVRNHHEIIAAASLGPEKGKGDSSIKEPDQNADRKSPEELDSYLYQTVGQDAIEFVAQALDLPLYRKVISGSAVEQSGEYGSREPSSSGNSGIQGDETEDLYDLLRTVKEHHPEVEGVSVGAILSNYQRVRVEHVCQRLSLTALCYLWQRNQKELLAEMIEAGVEAVLIKVAGIGLTVKHLGKTLSEMQPTLLKLNALYDSHVCGEGGEYETLTLDCPIFKHRIVLAGFTFIRTDVETVIHSDNDWATVAYLRVKSAALEPKKITAIGATLFALPIPRLLDENFSDICNELLRLPAIPPTQHPVAAHIEQDYLGFPTSSRCVGDWVGVSNVQVISPLTDITIEDEVVMCFHNLSAQLAIHALNLTHIATVNLFLSSMEFFPQVNKVYGSFFGSSPPSRATIALDLPHPTRVRLDCIAHKGSGRQSLHVQSLSYWAPANIGPYSQAITVDERIFISGQIGLSPPCMLLPNQSIVLETAFSLQHLHRIIQALKSNTGGGWDPGIIQGVICWIAQRDDVQLVKLAWERARSRELSLGPGTATLFVVPKGLPKGALVEVQALLHTGRKVEDEEDGETEPQVRQKPRRTLARMNRFVHGDKSGTEYKVHWEMNWTASSPGNDSVFAILGCEGKDVEGAAVYFKSIPSLNHLRSRGLSIRLFYRPDRTNSQTCRKLIDELFYDADNSVAPSTMIPVRGLSGGKAEYEWDIAICILAV